METILHEIVAPKLTDAAFGRNIREQFENINENFKILSNHDFIKGDKGESILYKDINLDDDLRLKDKIIETINPNNAGINDIYTDQGIIKWDDNLKNLKITIFQEEKTHKYISSLPILFLDARFNTNFQKIYYNDENKTKEISIKEAYKNKTDLSCVLYIQYDNDRPYFYHVIKTNTWPQLYYDTDINDFCWMYQGQETSLPARGPKGNDQMPIQNIFNVKVNNNSDGKILQVLFENNWIDIKTYIDESNNKGYPKIDKYSIAIVFNDDKVGEYWISQIYIIDDIYKVFCDPSTSISFDFNSKTFDDILNTIYPTGILKSIHIPSSRENQINNPTHCIFASHPEGIHNGNLIDMNIGVLTNYNLEINWQDRPNINKKINPESWINIWNKTNFNDDVIISNKKDLIVKGDNIYNKIETNKLNINNLQKQLQEQSFLIFDGIPENGIPINEIGNSLNYSGTPAHIYYNKLNDSFVFEVANQEFADMKYQQHHTKLSEFYNTSEENKYIYFNKEDKQLYTTYFNNVIKYQGFDTISNIIYDNIQNRFLPIFDIVETTENNLNNYLIGNTEIPIAVYDTRTKNIVYKIKDSYYIGCELDTEIYKVKDHNKNYFNLKDKQLYTYDKLRNGYFPLQEVLNIYTNILSPIQSDSNDYQIPEFNGILNDTKDIKFESTDKEISNIYYNKSNNGGYDGWLFEVKSNQSPSIGPVVGSSYYAGSLKYNSIYNSTNNKYIFYNLNDKKTYKIGLNGLVEYNIVNNINFLEDKINDLEMRLFKLEQKKL